MRQNVLRLEKYKQIRPFFEKLLESGDLSNEHMSTFWKETLEQIFGF